MLMDFFVSTDRLSDGPTDLQGPLYVFPTLYKVEWIFWVVGGCGFCTLESSCSYARDIQFFFS